MGVSFVLGYLQYGLFDLIRFLLGKSQSGSNFVVRFSRDGFDAANETDLNNFILHEDIEFQYAILAGSLVLPPNSSQIVDTGIDNNVAPNDVFLFAQKRFDPSVYYTSDSSLYCTNQPVQNEFRNIVFHNRREISVVVSYVIFNRRVGIL